jgi:hypothetical protein
MLQLMGWAGALPARTATALNHPDDVERIRGCGSLAELAMWLGVARVRQLRGCAALSGALLLAHPSTTAAGRPPPPPPRRRVDQAGSW